MPVLDDATKWVVGWAVGQRANTDLALEALSMAAASLADVWDNPGVTDHPS